MLPVIKIYKMDWNFLIQNYLDPTLWKKEWTLFEYKSFKVNISLYQISTKNEKIWFEISLSDKDPRTNWITTKIKQVDYSLKIDEIKFLKKKINSTIWDLFILAECDWYICLEDEYEDLRDLRDKERDKLKEIAEEFLDDNDIDSDRIREAYIEAYIDEYEKVWYLMQDYKDGKKYKVLSDLYWIWLDSLDEEDEYKRQTLEKNLDQTKIDELKKEIEEYKKYMETIEWEEEMQSNLKEV